MTEHDALVLEPWTISTSIKSLQGRPQVCGGALAATKGRFPAEFCARSLSRIFKCQDALSVQEFIPWCSDGAEFTPSVAAWAK